MILYLFLIVISLQVNLVRSFHQSLIVDSRKQCGGMGRRLQSTHIVDTTSCHSFMTQSSRKKNWNIILGGNKRNALILRAKSSSDDLNISQEDEEKIKKKKREKVMSFLRKVGAVGKNKDFTFAIGVDEGPGGKINDPIKKLEKTKSAYKWCTETGIIDDMTQPFPITSSGSEWAGFTDQVMGGISKGICTREIINGKNCNLMRGKVSLYNNGGFIQMATALSTDPAKSLTVNASDFDGVELDVLYKGEEEEEKFNVHLRNSACLRQFSSYRGSFIVKDNDVWQTVKIPFNSFVGYGPGSSETPFDPSELRRLGIVAIGKPMDVYLAVAGVRFYKE